MQKNIETNTNKIKQFCDQAKSNEWVSVDTEFLRERTYYAQLCLVQLRTADEVCCVDILNIDDYQPLADLFSDENVLKIFHAARQDVETLLHTFGVLPKPIFDTQLAAAFCGFDMQIAYSALVEQELGIQLASSQARTDWSRRPLSEVQIEYALSDVAYLHDLYSIMRSRLEEQGKLDWFKQETETLYDEDLYLIQPSQAYQRLNGASLRLTAQYAVKLLAGWREEVAQKKDIPRNWVMNDDGLYTLAVKRPNSEQQLRDLRKFNNRFIGKYASQVVALLQDVKPGNEVVWQKVEGLSRQEKSECSSLMAIVKAESEKRNVAQALLATRKDVEKLFRTGDSEKLLQTWRKEVIGEKLFIQLN